MQQARPVQPDVVTLGPRESYRRTAPAQAGPDLGEMVTAWLSSFSSKPRNEIATICLFVLGGALAIISFFLPWAAANGIAVGTTGSSPRGGAWAFDTPAGWPLVLLTLLVLGAMAASEQVQATVPAFASAIRRLTGIVLPMTLGGGLLGVGLLYLTLPWGCGSGLMILVLGGSLLVAGSIVALFFPSPAGEV